MFDGDSKTLGSMGWGIANGTTTIGRGHYIRGHSPYFYDNEHGAFRRLCLFLLMRLSLDIFATFLKIKCLSSWSLLFCSKEKGKRQRGQRNRGQSKERQSMSTQRPQKRSLVQSSAGLSPGSPARPQTCPTLPSFTLALHQLGSPGLPPAARPRFE